MQSKNNNNDNKIFIVGSDWVFHKNVKKFLILWIESMMDGEIAGRARVVTMIGELMIKNVRKYARPNLYPNAQLPVQTTQRCRSAAAVHFYGCTALKHL